MPTRVEKTKFYNPVTGHREETDIPGTKTALKARGYVPEGHPAYEAGEESPAPSPTVNKPSTPTKPAAGTQS